MSILLLVLFSALQLNQSRIVQLPVQWLWISVLPILLTLLLGGYVGKFKGAGFEFEPGMRLLSYAQPGSTMAASVSVDRLESIANKLDGLDKETEIAFEDDVSHSGVGSAKVGRSPSVQKQRIALWQKHRDEEYERTGGLFIVLMKGPDTDCSRRRRSARS